jgi:hypothetical protein
MTEGVLGPPASNKPLFLSREEGWLRALNVRPRPAQARLPPS